MKSFQVLGEYQDLMCIPVFRDGDTIWVEALFGNNFLPLMQVPLNLLVIRDEEVFEGRLYELTHECIDSYLTPEDTSFGVFNKFTNENILNEEFDSPLEAQKAIANMIIGAGIVGDQNSSYEYLQKCEIRLIK